MANRGQSTSVASAPSLSDLQDQIRALSADISQTEAIALKVQRAMEIIRAALGINTGGASPSSALPSSAPPSSVLPSSAPPSSAPPSSASFSSNVTGAV
ncbi:hypothetical protein SCP_0500680 [Sparassis crispa]|uniref:Uncharacterized protein n=1 Tax=Sparassis crispa TaxID=139825 RepID=A0A401GLH5_9APHY|nr:hypothetical protein SCP_0500680 [Sparassis crispa]GBE83025.1 hypothetical protein SCP_0500680 [Sparassis crispa]